MSTVSFFSPPVATRAPAPIADQTHAPGCLVESPSSPLRIGLPHMNVVLSITAEPAGNDVAAASESLFQAEDLVDSTTDPVIKRLVTILEGAAETDGAADVQADVIRLAVLARWLGIGSAGGDREPRNGICVLPKWRLKRVTAYIDENLTGAITLADLAEVAGLSKMYFAAQFRAATGYRPHDFVLRRRIEIARNLLSHSTQSIVDIALGVGFQTQAHFTTVFKKFVGETPKRWRQRQAELAPEFH
ncbi:helix-turn-helix transcriptional regulator [Pseudochelatococcus sp. B33]